MPTSNLPEDIKQNWVNNEIVMPQDVNKWSENINILKKLLPIYATSGNMYEVQSFSDNTFNLQPVIFSDDTQNDTPDSYINGMGVIFMCNHNIENSCKVNINSLGVKEIRKIDNTLITSSDIKLNSFVWLIYNEQQSCFFLVELGDGGGLPVGTVIRVNASSSYVPENCLYTDGSTQTKASFPNTYTDWLVGGKIETCTFEEFDQLVAQTGECWKWGLDTETETFRVPKINDIVVRGIADTVPARGNGKTLGLTDGTNEGGLVAGDGERVYDLVMSPTAQGVDVGRAGYMSASVTNKTIGITTDPNKSGIVAVTENALQTQTIKHFVVVATGSINQSEMDWSNYYSSLDGVWTANYSEITTATAIDTYNLDVSYLIPNDGYIYEALVSLYINRGDTSGTNTNLVVTSNWYNSNGSPIRTQADGANFQQASNSATLIIPTDRIVIVKVSGYAPNVVSVQIHGYRKVR